MRSIKSKGEFLLYPKRGPQENCILFNLTGQMDFFMFSFFHPGMQNLRCKTVLWLQGRVLVPP